MASFFEKSKSKAQLFEGWVAQGEGTRSVAVRTEFSAPEFMQGFVCIVMQLFQILHAQHGLKRQGTSIMDALLLCKSLTHLLPHVSIRPASSKELSAKFLGCELLVSPLVSEVVQALAPQRPADSQRGRGNCRPRLDVGLHCTCTC
jgi:hypothetical protein